jgi:hypothetical protein
MEFNGNITMSNDTIPARIYVSKPMAGSPEGVIFGTYTGKVNRFIEQKPFVDADLVEALIAISRQVINNHGTTICMNSDDDLERFEAAIAALEKTNQ